MRDAALRYELMSPVDRALHDDEQRRSWVVGQNGNRPPAHPLADEVRKQRAEIATLREQLAAARQLARLAGAKVVRDAMTGIGNLCDAQQDSVLEGADVLQMLAKLSPAADLSELEGLVRDAERYRHKREVDWQAFVRRQGPIYGAPDMKEPWLLSYDTAIDAAMKGAEQ